MDAALFLETLFADAVGDPGELVLWESVSKRSFWARSIAEAAEAAARIGAGADVYFGVSLQNRAEALIAAHEDDKAAGRPPRSIDGTRGFSRTAVAIGSIFADIDVSGPTHKKQGLAPSLHAIISKLEALPVKASIVLATGGGAQAHWVLREPFVFAGPEERVRFEAKLRGWQRLIQQEIGYTVDPTTDLARVLRMPGLPNHKYPGKLVELVSSSGARYNPSDFDAWETTGSTKSASSAATGMFDGIRIDPNAQPNLGKVMAVAAMDASFRATWMRKRVFPSQSEYDMSLASSAARYGWTDQEIVDLCIAHRREGGVDKEQLRAGYFRLLLTKIRVEPERQEARESLEARTMQVSKGEVHEDEARPELLDGLSKTFGLRVIKIVRFLMDPPSYRIDLPDCSISFPNVESILSPNLFAAALAAGARRVLQPYKRAEWAPIAQAIISACVDEDIGVDADPAALMVEQLAEFLDQHKPYPEEDRHKAIEQRRPWSQGPDVCFFLGPFAGWLAIRGGEKTGRKTIAKALKKAGAHPRTVYVRAGSTTAQAWRIARAAALRAAPAELIEPKADV